MPPEINFYVDPSCLGKVEGGELDLGNSDEGIVWQVTLYARNDGNAPLYNGTLNFDFPTRRFLSISTFDQPPKVWKPGEIWTLHLDWDTVRDKWGMKHCAIIIGGDQILERNED